MQNRKECFVDARVSGTLGQEDDGDFSKKTKMFSLPSDPRLTEVLNGRIKGQLQPANKFHIKYISNRYQNSMNQETSL